MSLRRRLSWSSALQGLHADRTRLAPGVLTAKTRTELFARIRKLVLATAKGFNRKAIMALAMSCAQAQRARTGEPWSVCLSAALKGAWLAAKSARHAAAI